MRIVHCQGHDARSFSPFSLTPEVNNRQLKTLACRLASLDRLARSLPHLIETVNQLEKSGAGLRSLTEAIDTTTPGGCLIFHVFGAR